MSDRLREQFIDDMWNYFGLEEESEKNFWGDIFDNVAQPLIEAEVDKARREELNMVDAAWHHTIDNKIDVSLEEFKKSGIDSITIDHPDTTNAVFHHIHSRLAQLNTQEE